MFQIRSATYIVDELTADHTDKLENACQFSVNSKCLCTKYRIVLTTEWKSYISVCEKKCEYPLSANVANVTPIGLKVT